MQFSYEPQAVAMQRAVRAFLDQRHRDGALAPALDDAGRFGPHFARFYEEVLQRGWVAVGWPRDYGGQGGDIETQYAIEEEFARFGFRIGGGGTAAPQILGAGTDTQKAYFIPRIIQRRDRFAMCLTEPTAGTDMAGITCAAVRDGAHYVLTGEKCYISGVPAATHLLLLARSEPGSSRKTGLSVFLVPKETPGITVEPVPTVQSGGAVPARTIFPQTSLSRIVFEAARIPATCLLGAEGEGWRCIGNRTSFDRVNPRGWISAVAPVEDFAARLAARDVPVTDHEYQTLGRHWLGAQATRLLALRGLALGRGSGDGTEAAMQGVWEAEYAARATQEIAETAGPAALTIHADASDPALARLVHGLRGVPVGASHHGGTRALRDQIARRRFDLGGGA